MECRGLRFKKRKKEKKNSITTAEHSEARRVNKSRGEDFERRPSSFAETQNIHGGRSGSTMAAARFPCSGIVSPSSCTWGKRGRHTHGWSAAPHGPALCGLCPTSDSGGSQPGCARLPFSRPFLCVCVCVFYSNNVELQEETGTALYLHHRFMRHSCVLRHRRRFPL